MQINWFGIDLHQCCNLYHRNFTSAGYSASSAEKYHFFCELHADLMGLFRRDLPRRKGLDQVAAQVRSLVDGVAAGPGKFDIRSFGGAAIGGYKQLSVRLFRVADMMLLLRALMP